MDNAITARNLSDDNQAQRLRRGVVALGIALMMAVTMLKLGVSTPVRLVLVLPFLVASNGLFQGLYRT